MIAALIGVLFNHPKIVMGTLIGVVVLIVAGTIYFSGVHRGASDARDEVAQQNERAEDTAAGAERDVDACHDAGREWDQHTSTCR